MAIATPNDLATRMGQFVRNVIGGRKWRRALNPDALVSTPDSAPSLDRPSPVQSERRRIAMTADCHDCDALPKVPLAGQIVADETGRYQVMHNGIQVVAGGYCGGMMTDIIQRLQGHHEPQEERVFHELLKHVPAGRTMVELGSGWAYYSLWFAREVPDARLFCVEPDPVNLAVGERNFRRNGAAGTFVRATIGEHSRPPRPFPVESGDTIDTPEISVDALVERHGIDSIEMLLADVQGAELAALAGAARTIAAGRLRFALIATHHHSISGDPLTHQRCLDWIRNHGGHIVCAFNVVEGYAGDGMIAASFRPDDRELPPIEVSRNHPTNSLFRELEYDLADAWAKLDKYRRWYAWMPWRREWRQRRQRRTA